MNFGKLFKSDEEKNLERRIQVKQGRRRAERHIDSQRKKVQLYWDLAKKALQLGDRDILQHLAALIQKTRKEINNWERRLLYFDMIEAQRDQTLASVEFAKAFDAMAKTILDSADPEMLLRMQANLERSMLVAEELEDRLLDFQGSMDDLLKNGSQDDQAEVKEILKLIKQEAEQEPEADINLEIDTTLLQIKELLGRKD